MVVLGNQAAVDRVKKSEPTMNLDGSIIFGRNNAVTDTLEQEGIATIPFSLADGAFVDLSVKGARHLRCLPLCHPWGLEAPVVVGPSAA